ncbi:MAG: LysE family transporter [Planctomycetota bacterium]|nr:LysE family transporter [Planctomycetota bacterium]
MEPFYKGLFFQGLVVGFAIAAPVGPIGILCITRTLSEGRLSGFAAGLGAACADAMYGAVAAMGLTAVSQFMTAHLATMRLVGGLVLCALGVRVFLAKPKDQHEDVSQNGLIMGFFSTFLLTLTNPMTLLCFAGVFVSLGLERIKEQSENGMLLIAGVFTGSAAWWLLLSFGVGFFHARMSARALTLINRISGGTLFAFGLFAALTWFGAV